MHRIERTASGPSSTTTYSSRPRAFHLRRSINQSRHWRFRCEPPCSRSCTALAHRFLGAIDFYPRDAVLAQLLAMGLCLSVCLSVRLCLSVSVTSRSSNKTAKRRITHTTPHDTTGSLVFCCQRSPRNSNGVTPYEGAECRWVVKIGDFRQITGYISKTVQDRHIVCIKVE